MAQTQTSIPTKSTVAPNNKLSATEFNELNTVVNDNSNDAETRLISISGTTVNIDGRISTIEGTSIPIQSYTAAALPLSANDGTIALDTTNQYLVYAKNDLWYKVSDNTLIVAPTTVVPTTTLVPTTAVPTTTLTPTTIAPITSLRFKIDTTTAANSNSDQFILPLRTGGTYNFDIDWDYDNPGTDTQTGITSDANITHTYSSGGVKTIDITGPFFGGVEFNDANDDKKVTEWISFGQMEFGSNADNAFTGTENAVMTATVGPNTSATTSLESFWKKNKVVTSLPLMDTSNVTDWRFCFQNCNALLSIPAYDFSNVNNSTTNSVESMFARLDVVSGLPLFNTSNITDFTSFMIGCEAITSAPLYETSGATTFSYFLFDCFSLTGIPAYSTGNVTNWSNAFTNCTSLTTVPVLDYSSGTNFGNTFQNCALNSASIDNIMAGLVASNVTNETLSINNGTTLAEASWSAQAQTDVATLRSRGWTINTN